MAVAFVIAHPGITAALLGVRTPEQLADLLDGAGVKLSEDVLDQIDAIVPPGTDVSQLQMSYNRSVLKAPGQRRRLPAERPAAFPFTTAVTRECSNSRFVPVALKPAMTVRSIAATLTCNAQSNCISHALRSLIASNTFGVRRDSQPRRSPGRGRKYSKTRITQREVEAIVAPAFGENPELQGLEECEESWFNAVHRLELKDGNQCGASDSTWLVACPLPSSGH
jgi:hypothetical protein